MKKLTIIIGLLLILIVLLSCGSTKTISYDKVKKHEYTIVKVMGGKKDFRVDLLDTKTRTLYSNIFVAKKCETWQLYRVGDVVTLKAASYQISGQEFTDFVNIKETLCK